MLPKVPMTVPLPWFNSIFGAIIGSAPVVVNRAQKPASRWPRSLKVTRDGWWFISILLLIGMAAINTGNNLLYLVVATLLSLIIISGIMSESTLKRLRVKRESLTARSALYKNSPTQVCLEVEKSAGLLPSYSFKVQELETDGVEAAKAYLLKLDSKSSVKVFSEYNFKRRGQVLLPGVRISTSFPFGLFIKGKLSRESEELLIYPEISPVTEVSVIGSNLTTGTSNSKKGHGVELHNLREYTSGDDARFILWKSAPKPGPLLLKEYETEREQRVSVIFRNTEGSTKDPILEFEQEVDRAASYAAHFIGLGYSVGLKTLSEEISPRGGSNQLHHILRTLALITPVTTSSPTLGPSGAGPSVKVVAA